MADLALRLRVFIASPNDVDREWDLVERVLLESGRKVARKGLLIDPYRWEKSFRPGMGRPQDLMGDVLKESELTIGILWRTFGSPASQDRSATGTQEEIQLARTLVDRGLSDDVFVYFRNVPQEEAHTEDARRVRAFRRQLLESKALTFWDYDTPEELERIISNHLELWLQRWVSIPGICRWTLARASPTSGLEYAQGENRLLALAKGQVPNMQDVQVTQLARATCRHYQRHGAAGAQGGIPVTPRDARVDSPGVRSWANGLAHFASIEWFYCYCAIGLLTAILDGDDEPTRHREYLNPVHQYFAAIVRVLPVTSKERVEHTLILWLGEPARSPITRNYAAYVLGILRTREAAAALARAVELDPGVDVRYYAISALGQLRSRRYLDTLVQAYEKGEDDAHRLIAGQAICTAIGVAEYPA